MSKMTCRRLCGLVAAVLVGVAAGCGQPSYKWALADASVALPVITGDERPVRRAGAPPELLGVGQGGGQTVLVACEVHRDTSRPYWQRNAAYVIVIDGPVPKGTVEVTPENGRFIENAVWWPARSPYVGLEGRIKILSVSSSGIVADCAVRNVIARTGDPVVPLRGLYTFKFTNVDPSVLERCGIRYGS